MNDLHNHSLNLGYTHKFSAVKSKFIITIIFVIFTTLITSIYQLLVIGFSFIIMTYFFKPRVKNLLIKTLIPLPLIFSLSIVNFFSNSSTIYSSILFDAIFYTKEEYTIFLFLKSLLIVLFILIFIESESFYTVVYILDDFHFPKLLVSVLFLLYRDVMIIQEEFSRILDAQYNRGYNKPNYFSITHFRLIGNIIGGTLYRSLNKAENVAETLKSRNFERSFPHDPINWTFKDIKWITFAVIIISLLFTK